MGYCMKIMALYLPQFHRFPENDKWWGEGYTEWVAVRGAKKYFKNHKQPKVPYKYYDLDKDGAETWHWQASLAKEYGVDAFCIYHYWFEGKLLMEKPMEILLKNENIDINYCICWANESWARNWDGGFDNILMKQSYGDKTDWKKHFDYLLPFFKDKRYLKINNRPMINLYKTKEIDGIEKMLDYWNSLAKNHGFDGVYIVSAITAQGKDERDGLFDAYYYFEPGFTLKNDYGGFDRLLYVISSGMRILHNKFFQKKMVEHVASIKKIWNRVERRRAEKNIFTGTVIAWDNTPRRKERGTLYTEATNADLKRHLEKLKVKCKQTDGEWLYINAWNEWGEGAFLEPDEDHGYEYLETIRSVKN